MSEQHSYRYPLRSEAGGEGLVTLTIPRDTTSAEMRRLLAWMEAFAPSPDPEEGG